MLPAAAGCSTRNDGNPHVMLLPDSLAACQAGPVCTELPCT
jgi:hypothetical protein